MKQNEQLQNLNLDSEYDFLLTSDNEYLMNWLADYAKHATAMSDAQKDLAWQGLRQMLTRQLQAEKQLEVFRQAAESK